MTQGYHGVFTYGVFTPWEHFQEYSSEASRKTIQPVQALAIGAAGMFSEGCGMP